MSVERSPSQNAPSPQKKEQFRPQTEKIAQTTVDAGRKTPRFPQAEGQTATDTRWRMPLQDKKGAQAPRSDKKPQKTAQPHPRTVQPRPKLTKEERRERKKTKTLFRALTKEANRSAKARRRAKRREESALALKKRKEAREYRKRARLLRRQKRAEERKRRAFMPRRVPLLFRGGRLTKTVTVSACNSEILLERLRREGVEILRVKKGKNLEFEVRATDYAKVFAILSAMCYNIKKLRTGGVGLPLWYLKKRPVIAVGTALLFALPLICSPLVLRVEYAGNTAYRKEEFAKILADCGIREGAFASEKALKKGEAQLLSHFPSLYFASLQKKGYYLTVTCEGTLNASPPVKEKELRTDRDGVVTHLSVLRGKAEVRVGDSVRAGDLLVSGKLAVGENEKDTYVVAEAELTCRYHEERRADTENPALLALYYENAKKELNARPLEEHNSLTEGENGWVYVIDFTYVYCVRGGY